jgi:GMP synthase-like glutamine amidotransferase
MWMSHGDKLSQVPEGYKPVGEFHGASVSFSVSLISQPSSLR